MSAQRTVTHHYGVCADEVAAALQDVGFLRRRSQRTTDANVEIECERAGETVRVRSVRDLKIDLPPFAQRLIGSTMRTTDVQNWNRRGDRWTSTFTVEIQGLRADARGQLELSPTAHGCLYECRFAVSASVPLIGSKVEELLANKLAEGLQLMATYTAQQLHEDRSGKA